MNRVTVGGNRGVADRAVLVGPIGRRAHRFGPACNGLREGGIGILDVEADVAHAVAVEADVVVDRIVGAVGRRQDDAGLALLKGV